MLPRRLRHGPSRDAQNDGHTPRDKGTSGHPRTRAPAEGGDQSGGGAMSEDDSQVQRCSLRRHKKAARFLGGRRSIGRFVGERNNFEDTALPSELGNETNNFCDSLVFFPRGGFDPSGQFCRRDYLSPSTLPSKPTSPKGTSGLLGPLRSIPTPVRLTLKRRAGTRRARKNGVSQRGGKYKKTQKTESHRVREMTGRGTLSSPRGSAGKKATDLPRAAFCARLLSPA